MKCKFCNELFLFPSLQYNSSICYAECEKCQVAFVYNSETQQIMYQSFKLPNNFKLEVDYVINQCVLIRGYNEVIWQEKPIPNNLNPENIKAKIETIQTFR